MRFTEDTDYGECFNAQAAPKDGLPGLYAMPDSHQAGFNAQAAPKDGLPATRREPGSEQVFQRSGRPEGRPAALIEREYHPLQRFNAQAAPKDGLPVPYYGTHAVGSSFNAQAAPKDGLP